MKQKIIRSIIIFLNYGDQERNREILSAQLGANFLEKAIPTFKFSDEMLFSIKDIELTGVSNEDLIVFSMKSIVYDFINKTDYFASYMLHDELEEKFDELKASDLLDGLAIKALLEINDNDKLKRAIDYFEGQQEFQDFIKSYAEFLIEAIKEEKKTQSLAL